MGMSEEIQRLMNADLNAPPSDEALEVAARDVERALKNGDGSSDIHCETIRDTNDPHVLHFKVTMADPRLQQVSDKSDESLKAAIDLAYALGLEVRCRIIRDTTVPCEQWMVSPPAAERKPGFFPMWVVERPASEEFLKSVKTSDDGGIVVPGDNP